MVSLMLKARKGKPDPRVPRRRSVPQLGAGRAGACVHERAPAAEGGLAEHGTVQQPVLQSTERTGTPPLASGNEWRRVEGPPVIHTGGGP